MLFPSSKLRQSDLSDRWLWDSDSDAGYTLRSAYQQLTTHVEAEPPEVTTGDLIWHKQVLLKASIFAWRLLRDRLPTKNNLLRRGVVDAEAVMCVTGCGLEESAPHLFIHCPIFGTLWQHIRSWIGMSGVDPLTIDDHFTQFIHSSGHSKARRFFLQLIWLLCVWLVWNERNNILYNNIQANIDQLVEKVKFNSLWWLKANKSTLVFDTHRWWSDPLLCLGID